MFKNLKKNLKDYGFKLVIDLDNLTNLFFILLIPSIIKHFSYFLTFFSTGVYPSISPETIIIFKSGNYFIFLWREVFLSFVASLLYFIHKNFRFITFGYLIDPIINISNSLNVYLRGQVLISNFFIRNTLLPFLIIGPLLMLKFKEYNDFYKEVYLITFGLLFVQFLL